MVRWKTNGSAFLFGRFSRIFRFPLNFNERGGKGPKGGDYVYPTALHCVGLRVGRATGPQANRATSVCHKKTSSPFCKALSDCQLIQKILESRNWYPGVEVGVKLLKVPIRHVAFVLALVARRGTNSAHY